MKSFTRVSSFLSAGLSLALFFSFSMGDASAEDRDLQVKTKLGKVQGKQDGAVKAYLGIPYATPPVGPLRWREPRSAAKWKGVRPATEFGFHCMQGHVYDDMIFHDPGESEDCLTLNIWTPAKDKKEKLPVMVWIYGGGFQGGGTSEARQEGAVLASNGVVVVTMNYRLGIFGFFAHPDLSEESGRNSSGNYGLLDQTAALRWVKENIEAFGGDPGKVTLFGESAGSFSVNAQMASPLAKGLFQRAIGESGGALHGSGPGFPERKVAEERGAAFAHEVMAMDSVSLLRAIPADELLAESRKKNSSGEVAHFGADVDGYLLPESVSAIFAAGKQNDVPLLAGWNHDEGGVSSKSTVDSFQKTVNDKFGANAARVLTAYPAADDTQAVRAASDLAADTFIAYSTWKWIEAQATTGKQPVYRYRFDEIIPADPFHLAGDAAYHSGEISYVFGSFGLLHDFKWTPEDRTLSKQMQQYWTNFAKTGDPNGEGLPKWPVYRKDAGWPVMYLSAQPVAEKDKTRERDLLLDQIWGK